MAVFNIFLLALALAVDAFMVAFSYGLIIKKKKGISSLKIATSTALGQFIMPIIGWYGARSIYEHIEALDHWIAFAVFLALGLKIIKDALDGNAKKNDIKSKTLTLKVLIMIGIATSIDALVMGGTLFFMKENIWVAAPIIGLVTFICAFAGFHLNRALKKFPTNYLEIAAGIILIGLGIKVLVEHLQ